MVRGETVMRTLIVGDMHADVQVLHEVDSAAKSIMADRVILLGDYLDPIWPPLLDPADNLRAFHQVLSWAQRRGDVSLVLGNHEAGYMVAWESRKDVKSFPEIAPRVNHAIWEAQHLFCWATEAEGWLCTHAGISSAWAAAAGISLVLDAAALASAIDDIGWSLHGRTFLQGRIAAHSYVPAPLFQSPERLIADPYPLVDQAVGHTAVESCRLARGSSGEHLAFCDTMTMHDLKGRRTGDSSLLLIEDGHPWCLSRGATAKKWEMRELPLVGAWVDPVWRGV